MKKLLSFFFFFLYISLNNAQTSLDDINKTRCRHTLNGMIALSSWTGVNLAAGTVGVLTTKGELQHFFEMNIYFNVVNLGLAIPGLIDAVKAKRSGLNFEISVKEVQKIKTIYLFNAALDFTYITAGFLFREMGQSNNDINLRNRLVGYGNSFIVQGGFLLLYDFIAFGLHAANGKKLDEHWKKISFQPFGVYGLGLSVQYNLNKIPKQLAPFSIF